MNKKEKFRQCRREKIIQLVKDMDMSELDELNGITSIKCTKCT